MAREKYVIRTKEDWRQFIRRISNTDMVGKQVEVRDISRRTLPMNSRLHAMLTDISKSGMQFDGKEMSVDEWKAIFVSAHAYATKGGEAELHTGLEGEILQLRESTSEMTIERCTSLMQYIEAYCATQGITVSW